MFRATTAALVGVAAGTINLQIEDCGDASTHGHVAGISPSAVQQGKKTVVSGSGHLDTTAADGSFEVKVKAAGVTMQRCSGDLCSPSKCALPAGTGHVDYHGAACPLQAGDITLDFDVKVSRFVPSSLAHLDIEIESEGSAGKLLCAKIKTSPGLSSEAECVAPSYNLASQTNVGVVTTTVDLGGIKRRETQEFMEKADLEKFNVRGESTLELKTPLGKELLTQKHILSIERKRFVLALEAKGKLSGHHTKCVKMDLPAKTPEPEVFAEFFKKFNAAFECKETDGAVDTWRFSKSGPHFSEELEVAASPDSLFQGQSENTTIGLTRVHRDVIITTATVGGPEEADLDETQFGDCEEIPMPHDSAELFAESPAGFFTRHIMELVQQIPEDVVV